MYSSRTWRLRLALSGLKEKCAQQVQVPVFFTFICMSLKCQVSDIVSLGCQWSAAHSHCFFLPSWFQVAPEHKEFSLGVATLGDTIGIALAGAAAIPSHNHICMQRIRMWCSGWWSTADDIAQLSSLLVQLFVCLPWTSEVFWICDRLSQIEEKVAQNITLCEVLRNYHTDLCHANTSWLIELLQGNWWKPHLVLV